MTEIVTLTQPPIVFSTAHTNVPPFAEVLLGENLRLVSRDQPIESIAVVAAPGDDEPVIEQDGTIWSILPAAIGRYHLRARASGLDIDISIACCEPEAIERIPSHAMAHRAPIDPRRVLRELAKFDPTFTGRADELVTRNLANYGAA